MIVLLVFSKFRMIGLCNSSTNCRFNVISLLTAEFSARIAAAPEDFLSKNYKPLKQGFFGIHHILDF